MNTQYPLCPRCGKNPADQITQDELCCKPCLDKEPEICDFCSAANPTWQYPTRSFATGETIIVENQEHPTMSTGDWAACADCHALIATKDWTGLLKRSVRTLAERHPELPTPALALAAQEINTLHQQFRRHRLGAPSPWTAREKEVL